MEVPHGTQKVLEVIVDRGPEGKTGARWGVLSFAGRNAPSSTTTPRRYSVFGARWCNAFWLRNARSSVVPRGPVRSTTSTSWRTCYPDRARNRPGSSGWLHAAARPWSSAKSATRPFIENDRSGTHSKHRPLASCLRSKDSRAVLRGADGKGRSRLSARTYELRHKPIPRQPPTLLHVQF